MISYHDPVTFTHISIAGIVIKSILIKSVFWFSSHYGLKETTSLTLLPESCPHTLEPLKPLVWCRDLLLGLWFHSCSTWWLLWINAPKIVPLHYLVRWWMDSNAAIVSFSLASRINGKMPKNGFVTCGVSLYIDFCFALQLHSTHLHCFLHICNFLATKSWTFQSTLKYVLSFF